MCMYSQTETLWSPHDRHSGPPGSPPSGVFLVSSLLAIRLLVTVSDGPWSGGRGHLRTDHAA